MDRVLPAFFLNQEDARLGSCTGCRVQGGEVHGRFQLHTSALRQLLECKPWAEAVALKALQKAGAYTQALVILYEK